MSKLFKFIFGLLFLFVSHDSFAEDRYLKWIDPETHIRFRINLDSYNLTQEVIPGVWQNQGRVNSDANIFNHVPSTIKSTSFFLDQGNRIRFTIDGSGHVFDFFPAKQELIRVDNTYHSGYNFNSNKFIRNGLIYSVGGEGFWNHNTVITYFDEKLKEWEILRPKNVGPQTICKGYQGYESKNDVYYSGASHNVNFLEEQTSVYLDDFYCFDFKKNSWDYLGKINPELPFRTENMILWTGKWFLHFDLSNMYIIDPEINEVRVFKDYTQSLIYFNDFIVRNDSLIAFKEKNAGSLTTISLTELRKNSTYWGQFYTSSKMSYIYYLVSVTIIFLIGFIVWRYKELRKKKNFDFTKVEKNLLTKLLSLQSDEYLTTHDINDILEASGKSQENQRRIRFNVISQLNNKLKSKFGSESGIERKSLPEDKRLTIYVLDSQIVSELRKLLQD